MLLGLCKATCVCVGVKFGSDGGPLRKPGGPPQGRTGPPRSSLAPAVSKASWQGLRTKGQNKIVKGFAAKDRGAPATSGGRGISSTPGRPESAVKKKAGKRPAVAARKVQNKKA